MFENFLNNFKKLPISNKSMIYLNWINSAGSLVSVIFINIYVFSLENSLTDVIIYNLIFFTFLLFGFSLLGTIMSILKQNIKNMYYIGYILFIIAFLVLFILEGNKSGVYAFSCIFSFGTGAFWCAVHTQELKNIEDKNRDFYSSSITSGKNIIIILMPALVGIVFYLAEIFNFNGYKVLFLALPIMYLFSFLFIKNIDNYIPKTTTRKDLKNFFLLKKYKYGHFYFAVSGFILALANFLIPVLNIYFLKNEINVSFFQAILTFISSIVITYLSTRRAPTNRLKYLFIVCILISINFIFLGFYLGITSFIIFSLINIFLLPIFRVSEHVYDLYLMDGIRTEESDFFPAMILREVILWFGRVFVLSIILAFIIVGKASLEETLRISLFLSSLSYLYIIICIYFWEKFENEA